MDRVEKQATGDPRGVIVIDWNDSEDGGLVKFEGERLPLDEIRKRCEARGVDLRIVAIDWSGDGDRADPVAVCNRYRYPFQRDKAAHVGAISSVAAHV